MADGFNLGHKLRGIRLGQGLTLRELARKAGCSPSFVSQIELNQASPTVANLARICDALKLTVSDFLQNDVSLREPVVGKLGNERPVALRWSSAKLQRMLPADVAVPFSAMILTLDVGGSTPPRGSRRSYNELAVVLLGEVELRYEGTVYRLKGGENIYFDLGREASWQNVGESPAQVLLTNGCAFRLFEQDEEDLSWEKKRLRENRGKRAEKPVPERLDAHV